MKKKIIGIFVCMLLITVAVLPASGEPSENGWTLETVDSEGCVGLWSSIVIDQYDNPHIIYHDAYMDSEGDTQGLKYAHKVGEDFSTEFVDSGGEAGWTNTPKSIVIDSNGFPHLVYLKHSGSGNGKQLKYAKLTNEGWDITIIAQKESDGELPVARPSIALDSTDTPHIVYIYERRPYNQAYGGIKYVTWNGVDWISEIVDSGYGDYGLEEPKIVMGSEDTLHICFREINHINPGNYLNYAKRTESGWTIEQVGETGTGWTDFALDSNDNPHITHCNNHYLMYVSCSSNGWSNTELDLWSCGQTSIAIDSEDHPHISYRTILSDGNCALKHVWWNGQEWIFSLVDYGDYDDTAIYTSIDIDSQDRPHISYFDGNLNWGWNDEGDLKYACGDNSQPNNSPPKKPVISGPPNGQTCKLYEYNFSSTDPDGNEVYYEIDWGDGFNFTTRRHHSGGILAMSHGWRDAGTYIIKARAIDDFNKESEWGTLQVTMPVNQHYYSFPLLQRLLERFPNAFPILRYLIEAQY